jgi:hypothetical protein
LGRIQSEVCRYKKWSEALNQQKEALLKEL